MFTGGVLYLLGTALTTFFIIFRPSSVPRSKAPITPKATPIENEEKEPSFLDVSDGVVICVDVDW